MGFLLLGIDSLIACIAIGALVPARWRLPFAALFGVADGTAFLIGAGIGWQMSEAVTEVLGTGTLLALGLYLLVVAAGMRRVASASWAIWALPFVLTVDNFAYGVLDDGESLVGQLAEQTVSSALLALIGLLVAVQLPRVLPVMRSRAGAVRFAGAALVVATGALFLLG